MFNFSPKEKCDFSKFFGQAIMFSLVVMMFLCFSLIINFIIIAPVFALLFMMVLTAMFACCIIYAYCRIKL